MPLYALGLLGMTRRMQHYADMSWQPYLIVAEVGALVILCGIAATIAQLVVSIRTREQRRDRSGDPWTVEPGMGQYIAAARLQLRRSAPSGVVGCILAMKQGGTRAPPEIYEPIEMPRIAPTAS